MTLLTPSASRFHVRPSSAHPDATRLGGEMVWHSSIDAMYACTDWDCRRIVYSSRRKRDTRASTRPVLWSSKADRPSQKQPASSSSSQGMLDLDWRVVNWRKAPFHAELSLEVFRTMTAVFRTAQKLVREAVVDIMATLQRVLQPPARLRKRRLKTKSRHSSRSACACKSGSRQEEAAEEV